MVCRVATLVGLKPEKQTDGMTRCQLKHDEASLSFTVFYSTQETVYVTTSTSEQVRIFIDKVHEVACALLPCLSAFTCNQDNANMNQAN